MKNSFIYAAKTALYFLLITGMFAACSNSTSSEEEEEQEPIGIRIKSSNQTVLEYIANPTNTTTTGTISVASNSTTSFTVLFLDEELNEFTPDPAEHSIVFSGATNIATFSNISADSSPFSFDVSGISAGTSNFVVTMNHQGAPEFVTIELPISITATTTK